MVQATIPPAEGVVKKKAYHHGDLRNAIILQATARARFQGERAIILREIATEIGVSATAAYRHFANRQQLVEEVAAAGFSAMSEKLALPSVLAGEADAGLAAYVDLRNAALAAVAFTGEEPAWSRMMVAGLGESATVIAAGRETEDLMQEIVDRGVEAGMFLPGTELRHNRVFWAGVAGLCTHVMFGLQPMGTSEADVDSSRTLDLCMSDMLTDAGREAVAAADLPAGAISAL